MEARGGLSSFSSRFLYPSCLHHRVLEISSYSWLATRSSVSWCPVSALNTFQMVCMFIQQKFQPCFLSFRSILFLMSSDSTVFHQWPISPSLARTVDPSVDTGAPEFSSASLVLTSGSYLKSAHLVIPALPGLRERIESLIPRHPRSLAYFQSWSTITPFGLLGAPLTGDQMSNCAPVVDISHWSLCSYDPLWTNFYVRYSIDSIFLHRCSIIPIPYTKEIFSLNSPGISIKGLLYTYIWHKCSTHTHIFTFI